MGCAVHVYPCAAVVEGHKGLLVYTPELIKVRRKRGALSVIGRCLVAEEIARDQIVVKGCIERVEWQ